MSFCDVTLRLEFYVSEKVFFIGVSRISSLFSSLQDFISDGIVNMLDLDHDLD